MNLISIITSADDATRNQSLDAFAGQASVAQLLEACAQLDAFRRSAENLYEMSRLATPIICLVIGEGGSGGALGIGVGDRVAMLEHSYYAVISPEGCAGILWKSHQHAERAAKALR